MMNEMFTKPVTLSNMVYTASTFHLLPHPPSPSSLQGDTPHNAVMSKQPVPPSSGDSAPHADGAVSSGSHDRVALELDTRDFGLASQTARQPAAGG